MLLMKDRRFLYELRAYPICVKVGENNVLLLEQTLDKELIPLKRESMSYNGRIMLCLSTTIPSVDFAFCDELYAKTRISGDRGKTETF